MVIEVIGKGKYIVSLTEDEVTILHSVCHHYEVAHSVFLCRLIPAVLKCIYNLLYPNKTI